MKGQKPKVASCEQCMFAFLIDYGYSNYSVEGTYFYCGINKHPEGPFDRWYGKDQRLAYAQKCKFLAEGKCIEINVDRDNIEEQKMTPAQLILWRERIEHASDPPNKSEDD